MINELLIKDKYKDREVYILTSIIALFHSARVGLGSSSLLLKGVIEEVIDDTIFLRKVKPCSFSIDSCIPSFDDTFAITEGPHRYILRNVTLNIESIQGIFELQKNGSEEKK